MHFPYLIFRRFARLLQQRLPLIISFWMFIALCISLAYWTQRLFQLEQSNLFPIARPALGNAQTDAAKILFGQPTKTVLDTNNYQLKGVIIAASAHESIAILSVNGREKVVLVNMEVVPGVTIKEMHHEWVLLSEEGVIKRINLPLETKGQAFIVTTASKNAQTTAHGSMAALFIQETELSDKLSVQLATSPAPAALYHSPW